MLIPARQQRGSNKNNNGAGTFCLFILMVVMATANVFLVTFVWDKTISLEKRDRINPVPQQPRAFNGGKEEWLIRKKISPEDWTHERSRCRTEECQFAQMLAEAYQINWSPQEIRRCNSGLFTPLSSKVKHANVNIEPTSPCLMREPQQQYQECKYLNVPNEPLKILIEHTDSSTFLFEMKQILEKDESFPVGLLTNIMFTNGDDWDIRITSSATQNSRIHEEEHVVSTSTGCKRKTIISLNEHAKANPSILYGAIRSSIGDVIQRSRREVKVKIAVLLVWTGSKPPPVSLLNVAKSFVESDSRIVVLVMIENVGSDEIKSAYSKLPSIKENERIKLIHHYDEVSKGNLNDFIHSRADILVPAIKGHDKYVLGWSLCDFRWLFGAIFENFLPEDEFTHWAWGDSDAYVGKLFGPISDYGFDYERNDVTTYSATIVDEAAFASSMMGYSSGTFTIIKNNDKGRNLFRYTPKDRLERGLVRSSNGVLDEVITSNAVFSAPNVTIALIGSQSRRPGTIYDESTGKLYFVSVNIEESEEMESLKALGRVSEPHAIAPFGNAQVLGRFIGGDPLKNQFPYFHPNDNIPWYHPPKLDADQFLNLKSKGSGFATLIRDQLGHWWHRPLPFQTFHRSKSRNDGTFFEQRPITQVELGIVHSRLHGPCRVKDATIFDYPVSQKVEINLQDIFDQESEQCRPFRTFFKKRKGGR